MIPPIHHDFFKSLPHDRMTERREQELEEEDEDEPDNIIDSDYDENWMYGKKETDEKKKER